MAAGAACRSLALLLLSLQQSAVARYADQLRPCLAGGGIYASHAGIASPIQYSLSTVKDPDRVVVDLEHVALTPELEKLPAKIDAADPYIHAVRIGRFKPGVLRLVLDLKTEAIPQAFVTQTRGQLRLSAGAGHLSRYSPRSADGVTE